MKLYYVANNQLPTPKAHGLQIMKMCEAFASLGIECELIIPDRRTYPSIVEKDPLAYYEVKHRFKVTRLPSADFITVTTFAPLAKFFFWLQQLAFGFSVRRYLSHANGVIYARDPFSLFVLSSLRLPMYWEMHSMPKNINSYIYRKVLRAIRGIITISNGLREDVARIYAGQILVAPDGVSLEMFQGVPSRNDARVALDLPQDKKIVVYTGHLYGWKGVDTLFGAAESMPEALFVLVGGTPEDVRAYHTKYGSRSNIILKGFIPHSQVPMYLSAGDVVVLPNSQKERISSRYTSPLKLFEYMASGTPIVASDLPSIREIVDESMAVFVAPDNPDSLVEGISASFKVGLEKASHAKATVVKYAWKSRAQNIRHFMNL
ncbi:MAG: glycosyltransferase [Patescibacteria group bacterium]